jgi:hypothetical protein
MNLQENYKRLFKGRIRSNDSKLISEMESEEELEYLFGPSDKNPKTKNFYLTLLMRAQKEGKAKFDEIVALLEDLAILSFPYNVNFKSTPEDFKDFIGKARIPRQTRADKQDLDKYIKDILG